MLYRGCHAARLIEASLIFVAVQKKLIDREKPRSPSWFFDCHRSRAPNVKKATACELIELIGAKKGRNFKFNLFL